MNPATLLALAGAAVLGWAVFGGKKKPTRKRKSTNGGTNGGVNGGTNGGANGGTNGGTGGTGGGGGGGATPSDAIANAQSWLKNNGYSVDVTGLNDAQSRPVVRQFQKDFNRVRNAMIQGGLEFTYPAIGVDGKIGPNTRGAMDYVTSGVRPVYNMMPWLDILGGIIGG